MLGTIPSAEYRLQNENCFSAGPIIIISPPALVPADIHVNFTINCTAMGIPTPEIVWRLNWGKTAFK